MRRVVSQMAVMSLVAGTGVAVSIFGADALGRLGATEWRCVEVTGDPGDVAVVNLTPVNAQGAGNGQLVSSDAADPPVAANVNYRPGSVDPNVAMAPIGADGQVCFVNARHTSVHLVADHLGTISGSAFTPASPSGALKRLTDTRTGSAVPASGRRCFEVAGETGDVAVVNLTPVSAARPGNGQLVSSDIANPPIAANVNYRPGSVDPNVAMAPIGADGRVCFVNAPLASVHLVADHLGTIAASSFTPATTTGGLKRLIDTRTGSAVPASGRRCFEVAGAAGDVAVVNLTPVNAAGAGNGQLVSSDVANPPVAANVNYLPGSVDPNVAIAPIGANGQVCFVNARQTSVHLVADHLGTISGSSFTPATPSGAPNRLVDTRDEVPLFLETFDGDPSQPILFSSPRWDIRRNHTSFDFWETGDTMQAQHGPNCEPPPATHLIEWMSEGVYICKNHLMTAARGRQYGIIVLTPSAKVDVSTRGTVGFELSTEQMSLRDWVDVWVTPADDFLTLPCGPPLCPDGAYDGLPRNGVHATKNGPFWLIEVTRDGEKVAEASLFENLEPSPKVRTPFELELRPGGVTFRILQTGQSVDVDVDIGFTEGYVQWSHHSYNPEKDNSGVPATWHWDNFRIEPAVNYEMVQSPTERFVGVPGDITTVRFDEPAPAGAHLVFNAVCRVFLDYGSGWVEAQKVPGTIEGPKETSHSYFEPVPAGTRSVRMRFEGDGWYDGLPCLFERPVIFGP